MTQSNNPTGGGGALPANRFANTYAIIIERTLTKPAASPSARADVPEAARHIKLNERQARVLAALYREESLSREDVDRCAGASNGPAVIQALRRKGFDIHMTLTRVTDRDGREVRPGRYQLSDKGRELASAFFSASIAGGGSND